MKLVPLALSLLALGLFTAAGALAAPGALDRSFGDQGRMALRLDSSPRVQYPERQFAAAAAPRGGRIAVAVGTSVVLLADGRPLRGFGGDGRAAIAPPPNTRFLLGGVAIDSHGRVLVAGTVESTLGASSPGPISPNPQAPEGAPGPPAAKAGIYRLLPDGSPDASFGSGGALVTDFGQQPPTQALGVPFAYPAATVKVRALALDGEDRPLLAGTSVDRVSTCNYMTRLPAYPTRTWVARLTAAGAPDPGFGEAGVYTNPGSEFLDNLALAPNGKVIYSSPTEEPCARVAAGKDDVVVFLGATGRAARVSFVAPVGQDLTETAVRSLAVDSHNRVVVLLTGFQAERGGEVVGAYVRRLRADGQIDTGFGTDGSAATGVRRGGLGAMALDHEGRILLTATNLAKSRVILARRGTRGKADLRFGQAGRTSVGWGTKSVLGAPVVIAERGGAVVLAPIGNPNVGAKFIALARFR